MTNTLSDAIARIHELPIEEFLEEFGFRKRGRSWTCGFHDDRTPSASVKHNHVKCFTCDRSWSLIDVVMEAQGMSFIQAVTYLCERTGIPLDSHRDEERFRKLRAAEEEARLFVAWREDLINQQALTRNASQESYWRILAALNRAANATLIHPENERLDRFVREGDLRVPLAISLLDSLENKIATADQELDRLTAASYSDLLATFRNRKHRIA